MKQEIAQLKVERRLSDVQWTGKEQNYKKTIQQLQSKVSPSMKHFFCNKWLAPSCLLVPLG